MGGRGMWACPVALEEAVEEVGGGAGAPGGLREECREEEERWEAWPPTCAWSKELWKERRN